MGEELAKAIRQGVMYQSVEEELSKAMLVITALALREPENRLLLLDSELETIQNMDVQLIAERTQQPQGMVIKIVVNEPKKETEQALWSKDADPF